jgi:hypothetical protein
LSQKFFQKQAFNRRASQTKTLRRRSEKDRKAKKHPKWSRVNQQTEHPLDK